MNNLNIAFVFSIAAECSASDVKYRFIDNRWKESGDIDIIIAKNDSKKFEKILYRYSFKRKGFWPPQSRMYKAFLNNELLSIGAHVGGYRGGFGGGLGKLGKLFEPSSSCSPERSILSSEEQLFILLYKYASRPNPQKYEKAYGELCSKKLSADKLRVLCRHAFKNSDTIVSLVLQQKLLSQIPIQFTMQQKLALSFRGKPNKILRRLYRIIKPAPVIALVGCNGVGKSTMVRMLAEKLEKENLHVATVYSGRIRFQMLPINALLKIFKPDSIEKKAVTGIQVREMRIFHSSLLNAAAPFVYYAEYFLRTIRLYLKRIFYDVVLMDRSFIDIFASPNLNKKICTVLFHLMPQPKHILLTNDVVTIAKRRPEFLRRHITQQLEAYSKLPYYLLRVKTDGTDAVNIVAKKISEMI